MKIAILIVGEYREFKISINSWNFLNNDNADYWISTWEVSKQNDFIETVSEKDYTNYLPNIKNIGIHPKEKIHISDNGNVDTLQAYRFNWMYCYETLLEKMESQNLKYDAMMIIRPDLWLENSEDFLTDSFITQLKDNTIYHIGPKHKEWINDLMFYGKFDVMWDFLSKVQYKPIEHNNLGKIIDENYNTEEHKGAAVIVRPSARIIKQKNYSDALFRRFDMEWTEERDINFKGE
jgi:hypothetical protein